MASKHTSADVEGGTEAAFGSEEYDQETAEQEAKAVARIEDTFVPTSFEDALNHFQETGEIVEFEGSPYQVVDKEALIDRPFIIVQFRENPNGDFGPFFSLLCMTDDNKRVVINDGSTGIAQQMRVMLQLKPGLKGGILCKNGLRVSEYTYEDEKGKQRPAKTYYIA